MSKLIAKSLISDFILTLLTSFLISGTLVYIIHVLAAQYSPDDMGLYLISRRYIGFFAPIILVGGAISIPRFVAEEVDTQNAYNISFSALSFTLMMLGAVSIVVFLFPLGISRWLFSGVATEYFVYAVLLYLSGYLIKTIAVGYYRGRIEMLKANTLNLFGDALFPLFAIGLCIRFDLDIYWLFVLFGCSLILSTIPHWYFGIVKAKFSKTTIQKLVNYGGPKALDGFANQGMLLSGPLVVQYFYDLKMAGIVIAGQVLLRIITTVFRPLGVVLLPRIVAQRSNAKAVSARVNDLLGMTLYLGTFVACAILVLVPLIVDFWLGEKYADAIPIMRVVTIAVVPYLFYIMLKSVIDGYTDKPVLTPGLLCSVAIGTLLTACGGYMGASVLLAVTLNMVGFVMMGGFILYHVNHLFEIRIRRHLISFGLIVLVNLLLWILPLSLMAFLKFESSQNILLVLLATFLVALSYSFFVYWRREIWFLKAIRRFKLL